MYGTWNQVQLVPVHFFVVGRVWWVPGVDVGGCDAGLEFSRNLLSTTKTLTHTRTLPVL